LKQLCSDLFETKKVLKSVTRLQRQGYAGNTHGQAVGSLAAEKTIMTAAAGNDTTDGVLNEIF